MYQRVHRYMPHEVKYLTEIKTVILILLKNSDLVSQLYLRKQNTYSENQVFPFLQLSDFKASLFDKVRNLIRNIQPAHSWLAMNNEELLRSAGLFKRDMKTGSEGYTLAAVLLLGTDACIQKRLTPYKTDAILRIENTDRMMIVMIYVLIL